MAQGAPQPRADHEAQARQLLNAVLAGRIEEVERCLASGFDVNAPITSHAKADVPVLRFATAPANLRHKVLALFLRYGADPNSATASGVPLLHLAASLFHYGMVRDLLAAGANPNYALANERRSCLVHGLSRSWHIEEADDGAPRQRAHPVSLFLAHGADPNAPISSGSDQRPLHLACEILDLEAVMALLAAGADPDPPSAPITPLWRLIRKLLRLDPTAVAIPTDVIGVVSLLLSSGAQPDPLLYPPPALVPLVPALINACAEPSQLSRLITKCFSLVIVAARHTLRLPPAQTHALIALFGSYLTQYSPAASLEQTSADPTQQLVALALRISPVCYGRRIR